MEPYYFGSDMKPRLRRRRRARMFRTIKAASFKFARLALPVVAPVLGVALIAHAGSLSPSASPAATGYTLSDIYTRLTTNAEATLGSHSFAPSAAPGSTLHTLTEIYNGIPTINPAKVLSDTTYLGVTGTIAIKSGDAAAASSATSSTSLLLTPAAGYYDGAATVSTSSAGFLASNIRSGSYIFGITGTMLEAAGDAGAADVFSGKTFSSSTAASVAGTLNLACNTATFDASGNLVATAYDGDGDGTDRWCMTNSGDAVAGDMLSGKIAWVDGVAVTGDMSAQTLSAANETVSAGQYAATTLSAVDADLAAGNIKKDTAIFGFSGTLFGDTDASKVCDNASAAGTLSVTAAYLSTGNTWCGTAGTLLANLWNGTSGAFTGGSQANGGADDYNNGGSPSSGRYAMGWTACTSGADNYCGTGDAFADMKDNSTGLIWSKPCSGSGCSTSAEPAGTTYSWDNSAVNNNSLTASELCSQDLGTTHDAGWYLPHQKQLMQAYIDGSYGNVEATGVNRYYWSATTVSYNTANAWNTYLSFGYTYYTAKTNASYVRCVRPAS
ncbi:MAG: hypothetical protein UY74_C0016G0015 [Candidatus Kaiserbacteria bacterium GW2011_GWC2_52_8b]|uniref:Lcl C-terminal domain-containing protein n=2 Tax=Candidatus Kaiseribacteriota TaxID=1752734 RepID=A0A0G1XJG1_9BACT|nr:MAG: hypothetical protein UY74_C0016G0015 [Candidatus Kaiserbacteria bacterium GW2011_GWC2_52_8b]